MSVRWLFKMASKINSFFVVVLGLTLLDVYEMKKTEGKESKKLTQKCERKNGSSTGRKGFPHT